MKFNRLDTAKAITNEQLAEGQNALHDCMHEAIRKIGDCEKRDLAMSTDIATLTSDMSVVKLALGQHPGAEKPHRTLASIKPWKAILAVVCAMGGVQITYQVFAPTVVAAAKAFNAAMMGG